METIFIVAHTYLFILSLWYAVLLFRYIEELSIPEIFQDAFDDDGESTCFSCAILFLLVCIGFAVEAISFFRSDFSNLQITPFIFGALLFGFLAIAFFVGWHKTALKSSQNTLMR